MKEKHQFSQRMFMSIILCLLILFESRANFNIKQEPSQEAVITGGMLFDGSTGFTNGGPSCISCHNVNNETIVSGGLLAKDLTNVFTRMGEAGLSGILGSPPFPAMGSAYSNNKLSDEEIDNLKAFLQSTDMNSSGQANISNDEIFLIYGPLGLVVWLIIIYFVWFNRKKESVKKAVFDRQIKPIN